MLGLPHTNNPFACRINDDSNTEINNSQFHLEHVLLRDSQFPDVIDTSHSSRAVAHRSLLPQELLPEFVIPLSVLCLGLSASIQT